jgi:xanthine dehydrogenase/oxidase
MALPFAPRRAEVPSALEKLREIIESEFPTSTLHFYMNGIKIELQNPNPEWTLLDFIRSQHDSKGTKLGCGEGGCGACTVVLQATDTQNQGRLKHMAVNACLFPLIGGTRSLGLANVRCSYSSSRRKAFDYYRGIRER